MRIRKIDVVLAIAIFLATFVSGLNRMADYPRHVITFSFYVPTIVIALIGSLPILWRKYIFSVILYIGYFGGGSLHRSILILAAALGLLIELLLYIYKKEKNKAESKEEYLTQIITNVQPKYFIIAGVVFLFFIIVASVDQLVRYSYVFYFPFAISFVCAVPVVWRKYLLSFACYAGFYGGYMYYLYRIALQGPYHGTNLTHYFIYIAAITVGVALEVFKYLIIKNTSK